MKLYIFYRRHDPYMYSDYPTNNDDWAEIHFIATEIKNLEKYVNRQRIMAENEFRKRKPHRFDDNDDSIDFSWTSALCFVLEIETEQELELDTREAFEHWTTDGTYKIYSLKDFFKEYNLQMWHPDPEVIKEINTEEQGKNNDIPEKLEQYKKLKEELHDRGYLGSVDG